MRNINEISILIKTSSLYVYSRFLISGPFLDDPIHRTLSFRLRLVVARGPIQRLQDQQDYHLF